jgi:hypothetical protein
MENTNETKNNKDDFYAVVSALARFIETADNDLGASPSNPHSLFEKSEAKTLSLEA